MEEKKTTNIYFMKDKDNNVKIGRSEDVDRRKIQLQTSLITELEILYVIEEMAPSMEQHIHGICRRFHIKGEWFDGRVIDHLLKLEWYKEQMKKPS
jgi:hypothetical protein